jgi:hypothetical protein
MTNDNIKSSIGDLEEQDLSGEYKQIIRRINVSQMQSDVLAAFVVSYKALNIGKEFAFCCMAELARRRGIGDDFDFESYIDIELAKIPKVESVDIMKITKGINNNIATINEIIKK